MGERHDLPKIKPDEQPSIVNYDAGIGAFFGNIGGFAASFAAPAKYRLGIILAGTALGGILGGMNGKKAQENDATIGKIVKTPGYWNKGIVAGMMGGWAITTPLKYLFKDGVAGKTALTVGTLGEIGGAIIGSIMRNNSLQRDFDKSLAIRDANHAQTQQLMEAVAANQQAPVVPAADEPLSFKDTVTPDEAALLMEKQAQAPAPVVEKPAHGPHHAAEAAASEAQGPEHHAAHGEHHDAPSHAAKHEHHQHTGSHADKHEATASHTDHAAKPEASMAMSA